MNGVVSKRKARGWHVFTFRVGLAGSAQSSPVEDRGSLSLLSLLRRDAVMGSRWELIDTRIRATVGGRLGLCRGCFHCDATLSCSYAIAAATLCWLVTIRVWVYGDDGRVM